MRFDYVTVGHVTIDILLDPPGRQPGGGAFYSALQAARLGLRTLIITQGVPHELNALLAPYRDELQVTILPTAHTTTLRTHGRGHARRQRLLAWAGPIGRPRVPDTTILHLAPVARETPPAWEGHAPFVGVTPQGLVRTWDTAGEIGPVQLDRALLPERCDAAVLSTAELKLCIELVSAGPVVAATAGAQPTTVYLPGGTVIEVPVRSVAGTRDDLGAGDVFASAFFIALHEGRAPADAAAFANAAAAVRIAGRGPAAIGDRGAVAARFSQPAPAAPPRPTPPR